MEPTKISGFCRCFSFFKGVFCRFHVSFRWCMLALGSASLFFFHHFHSAGKIVSLPIGMSDQLNPLKFGYPYETIWGWKTLEDSHFAHHHGGLVQMIFLSKWVIFRFQPLIFWGIAPVMWGGFMMKNAVQFSCFSNRFLWVHSPQKNVEKKWWWFHRFLE